MARYLWRDQYATPDSVTEYTPIPESRNDQHSFATNWFPEQYALKSDTSAFHQEPPPQFGHQGPPIDPLSGADEKTAAP